MRERKEIERDIEKEIGMKELSRGREEEERERKGRWRNR
jgi:hypothetical protein